MGRLKLFDPDPPVPEIGLLFVFAPCFCPFWTEGSIKSNERCATAASGGETSVAPKLKGIEGEHFAKWDMGDGEAAVVERLLGGRTSGPATRTNTETPRKTQQPLDHISEKSGPPPSPKKQTS